MSLDTNVDMFWFDEPELIKSYLDKKQDYEQLCTEVSYILRKRLSENNIKYASITQRTKALESFLNKIIRKNYEKPFDEINDIAVIRIVSLYKDDLPKISELIKSEFNVIEKVDKITEQGADSFGYSAVRGDVGAESD